MSSHPALEASQRFRSEHGWQIVRDFVSLLQIPNVTGNVADLTVNADELVRRFTERGAEMETVDLPGTSPVVIGYLRSPNPTATLGVYVHYDGQPVDPSTWTHPPFAAPLVDAPWHQGGRLIDLPGPGDLIDPDWRIYARGASDDKTPLAAILGALDALTAFGIEPTVDLVFLFEGEEESGSPNLDRYMEHLAAKIRADAWLLCDGPVHQSRRPQVAFGVRGYAGFELTVYGPERELHSGHYGNWVPNPVFDLVTLLAGCKDDNGRVVIDGFYADTMPISDADRAAIAAVPDVEEQLLTDLGVGGPESDRGLLESLMVPSFNFRGIRAADVGDAGRNVIPAEASASVDIRLAAGDDPERILARVRAHFERAGYHLIDREPTAEERRRHRHLARFVSSPHYRAVRIPMDSPLATTLLDVCSIAAGDDVVALPTFGGSMPLYLFEDLLGAPVVILPIANHDNNQHSSDENIRLANLWYGIDLWSVLLTTDFSAVNRN